jgi:hypothetical protein
MNFHLTFIAFLLIIFPIFHCQADLFGTLQSAAVKGNLLCNGKPSANTKVKLYDVDSKPINSSCFYGNLLA